MMTGRFTLTGVKCAVNRTGESQNMAALIFRSLLNKVKGTTEDLWSDRGYMYDKARDTLGIEKDIPQYMREGWSDKARNENLYVPNIPKAEVRDILPSAELPKGMEKVLPVESAKLANRAFLFKPIK